jgi:hypothetical protein
MTKLEKTISLIQSGVKHFPKGMICWSGGKDSMVLLHIMRGMGLDMPLVFFREPWQPWKYKFHDKLIQDWGLLVYSWHPNNSAFQQTDDEWEVQNCYTINNTTVTCPTGIVEPAKDLPYVCSIDILKRPKQHYLEVAPFDCLWIGHKGCDSDPILGGDAGTRIESRVFADQPTMMFPLRDWTHEDVWAYIEENNVPYDEDRYEKVDGVWGEKRDKSHNVDYVHACTRCVDRREGADKFVDCPKIGMKIENISHLVPWADQEKLSYMKD